MPVTAVSIVGIRLIVSSVEKDEIAGLIDPEPTQLGRRAVRGGLTAVSFQAMRMALQIASLAVFARLLSPTDFGIVVMATTVTAFVGMFSDLGLSAATVQRKTIDQNLVSALWVMHCALGLAVMLLCFALAPFAAIFYETPAVAAVVMASALAYPFTAAAAQHGALLARRMQWLPLYSIPVIASAVGLLCAMLLAWKTELAYWSLVIGNLVTPLVQCLLYWRASSWRPSRVSDWSNVRSAISFGAYLTGFQFLTYFHRSLDNVIIGSARGTGDLGHYSRAYSIFMLPLTLISGPVSTAVIPAMSRAVDDHRLWASLYLGAVFIITAIAAPTAIVLAIFADDVVGLLFGPGWGLAAQVLAALAPAMLVQPLFASAQWIFVSRGQTKQLFWASVPAIGAFILAYLVGIADGPTGVAQAYSIASFIVVPLWLAYAAYVSRMSVLHIMVAVGVPVAMAASIMMATEWAAPNFHWILRLVVFGLAYLFAMAGVVMASEGLRGRLRLLVQ